MWFTSELEERILVILAGGQYGKRITLKIISKAQYSRAVCGISKSEVYIKEE